MTSKEVKEYLKHVNDALNVMYYASIHCIKLRDSKLSGLLKGLQEESQYVERILMRVEDLEIECLMDGTPNEHRQGNKKERLT